MLVKVDKSLGTLQAGDLDVKDYGTPPTNSMDPVTKLRLANQSLSTKKMAKQPFEELHESLRFGQYFHVEVHPNGGARTLHAYQGEIDMLSPEDANELAQEFFQVKTSLIFESINLALTSLTIIIAINFSQGELLFLFDHKP